MRKLINIYIHTCIHVEYAQAGDISVFRLLFTLETKHTPFTPVLMERGQVMMKRDEKPATKLK